MTSKPSRSIAQYVLFTLAFLILALYFVAGYPLRQARLLWRDGKVVEARNVLESWAKLKVRPADYAEALAVVHLTTGNQQAAITELQKLPPLDRSYWGRLDADEVAERLVALGRYEELLIFSEALGGEEDLDFYRAAAMVGTGRVDEGAKLLAGVDKDDVEANAFDALNTAIAERQRGTTRLVLDRNGKAIATFDRATRQVRAASGFGPLFETSGGAASFGSQKSLLIDSIHESTLDPVIQAAAVEALGDFRGSLVAIDVATSEILAVANNAPENLAFGGSYEPGSVMKVLTTLAALENGVDVAGKFPYECSGILPIDGRQFHDWARHDKLESLDEALAVSCNLAFARLGIAVGAENLDALWRRAGFNSDVDLGFGPVRLGRRKGVLAPDFALATAACGLEFETTNSLHLATIATAVANGGTFVTPRLITAKRTIVGAREAAPVPVQNERIGSAESIAILRQAMKAVVTDPRGTGKRAAIDGLSIAMKTGTAGERNPAYDALVIAFAPADNPRIAIGIIAEKAGPAEFAGSRITHDFFAAIAARLKP